MPVLRPPYGNKKARQGSLSTEGVPSRPWTGARDAPIAVFDSGVGGLTVVAALQAALPNEAISYLGDTARLPYGTKSPAVVERYAMACARFLCGDREAPTAKLLVVACNTASAHALNHLQVSMPVPVLGVIEPGAALAVLRTRNGVIGVMATEGTVESGCYQRALRRLMPQVRLATAACPLLVPLAEEQMTHHIATAILAREYLAPLLDAGMDTLVLGCTHYPILTPLLQEICGPGVHIIDSASAVAQATQQALQSHGLLASERSMADRFYATDVGARLQRVGTAFLGKPMVAVELVDIATAQRDGKR